MVTIHAKPIFNSLYNLSKFIDDETKTLKKEEFFEAIQEYNLMDICDKISLDFDSEQIKDLKTLIVILHYLYIYNEPKEYEEQDEDYEQCLDLLDNLSFFHLKLFTSVREFYFFLFYQWIYDVRIGFFVEKLVIDSMTDKFKKATFRSFFLTMQEKSPRIFKNNRPIYSSVNPLEIFIFSKSNIVKNIRILLYVYNLDFLKLVKKKDLFPFYKRLIALTLQEGNYSYLNELLHPFEMHIKEGIIRITLPKKNETFEFSLDI